MLLLARVLRCSSSMWRLQSRSLEKWRPQPAQSQAKRVRLGSCVSRCSRRFDVRFLIARKGSRSYVNSRSPNQQDIVVLSPQRRHRNNLAPVRGSVITGQKGSRSEAPADKDVEDGEISRIGSSGFDTPGRVCVESMLNVDGKWLSMDCE